MTRQTASRHHLHQQGSKQAAATNRAEDVDDGEHSRGTADAVLLGEVTPTQPSNVCWDGQFGTAGRTRARTPPRPCGPCPPGVCSHARLRRPGPGPGPQMPKGEDRTGRREASVARCGVDCASRGHKCASGALCVRTGSSRLPPCRPIFLYFSP
jgi:hypothetical protein